MNAVTNAEGEQHFKEVQNEVLSDEMRKEHIPEEKMYAFIIYNAPLFRFFATHLPDEFAQLWDTADTNEQSRAQIEQQYEDLRARIKEVFERRFDADTQTALTDAAESGNIETAERILEAHLALTGRKEE